MRIEFLLLITGLLFLIPMIFQIRIYFFTRSISYLYFSLLFLSVIIGASISYFQPTQFIFSIINSLLFGIEMQILYQITDDTSNHNIPIKSNMWRILLIVEILGSILIKFLIQENEISTHWTSFRIAIGQVLQFIVSVCIIYSFKNLDLTSLPSKILSIRRVWIISGSILMTTSTVRFLIYFPNFILGSISTNMDLASLIPFAEDIDIVALLIIAFIVVIFSMIYPETLLISEVQLLKVHRLYQLLELIKEIEKVEDPRNNLFTYGTDSILSYLKDIADNNNQLNDV